MSLQQRAEQLSHLERQSEQSEWRRGEELRKRDERVRELQLELDRERGKEPVVKVRLIWVQQRNKQQSCSWLLDQETKIKCVCVFFFSQYVTKTVQVDSPATLKHLTKAKQRNELLSEKLAGQNERCKQLEEQIRKSDEYSCNLQHKVTQAAHSPAAGSYLS